MPAGTYDVRTFLQVNASSSSGSGISDASDPTSITYELVAAAEELGFWDAELYCVDRYRGHLASPNSPVEYAQLKTYLQAAEITHAVMIGLHSNAEQCRPTCEALIAAGAFPDIAWKFTDGAVPNMEFMRPRSLDLLRGTVEDKGAFQIDSAEFEYSDYGVKAADDESDVIAAAPMAFVCEIDGESTDYFHQAWCVYDLSFSRMPKVIAVRCCV